MYKTYIEVSDALINSLEEVGINFEAKGNMINTEDVESIITDLICMFHRKDEELEDLKEEKSQDWNGIGEDIKYGIM